MKKGDVVEIFNLTMGGRMVSEGDAKLVKHISTDKVTEDERWTVRFLSDGMYCDRTIFREGKPADGRGRLWKCFACKSPFLPRDMVLEHSASNKKVGQCTECGNVRHNDKWPGATK